MARNLNKHEEELLELYGRYEVAGLDRIRNASSRRAILDILESERQAFLAETRRILADLVVEKFRKLKNHESRSMKFLARYVIRVASAMEGCPFAEIEGDGGTMVYLECDDTENYKCKSLYFDGWHLGKIARYLELTLEMVCADLGRTTKAS